MIDGKHLRQTNTERATEPAEMVRDFQRKIYRKAKQEPKFRFYSLYDKVCRLEFLSEAYKRVKASKGSPGADGISFKDIEEAGVSDFILTIQKELSERSYRPNLVKRVLIPKANGKMRPLGIPTIRDRVVQMSCKIVIEPIFESGFEDSSFGFRPKRSAKDALRRIKEHLITGHHEVYDADLSQYFAHVLMRRRHTIPHDKLMKLIALRVSDKAVLHLIKMWLKASIIEDGKISGGKKSKKGTPQGGVISPLLANIYLNLVAKIVRRDSDFNGIQMVSYADDFVLMGRQIGEKALGKLALLLSRMELHVNESKTRLVNAQESAFEFLGFVIRYHRSLFKDDEYYWHITPSEKSLKSLRGKIRDTLQRNRQRNARIAVSQLNPQLRGWLNYFTMPGISYMKLPRRKIRIYLRDRLYRHQKRKSQRYRYAYCRRTFYRWVTEHQLVDPEKYGVKDLVKA